MCGPFLLVGETGFEPATARPPEQPNESLTNLHHKAEIDGLLTERQPTGA
jgi:hypothetical protein